MAYGVIGYGQVGQNNSTAQTGLTQSLPSGTIWGDCSSQELLDEATGYFVFKTFKDDATLPGLPTGGGTYSAGTGDDSSVNAQYNSSGSAVMYTRPLAPVAPNGSSKLWMEASVSPQQITAQTMFVGFATSTGLSSTLFASSTTLLSSAGLIGFYLHGDAPTNPDAVYKPTGTTAPTTVLASVLTASTNNPNPANVNYVPPVPPGAFTGSSWVKLGVRVDKTYAYYYVNGTQVAKVALSSAFDITDSYGAIIAAGTQTGNTDNIKVSFFRAAAKLF